MGPRQQQGEQFGAAFAVDDPVDEVRAEAPLESDHRFLLIGHIIAEPLEREQEAGVGPIGIDEVAPRTGSARRRLANASQEELAGIFLPRGRDIRMANDIAAADAVPFLDVGDKRDYRRDLLVGK